MKVLFIVHVEPMFEEFWSDDFLNDLADEMEKHDHVIILNSDVSNHYPWLHTMAHEVWDWTWGYEPCMFDNDEQKHVIPASGHEWTWIPHQMRDDPWVTKQELFVAGGCQGECLEDWFNVLESLELSFTAIPQLMFQEIE